MQCFDRTHFCSAMSAYFQNINAHQKITQCQENLLVFNYYLITNRIHLYIEHYVQRQFKILRTKAFPYQKKNQRSVMKTLNSFVSPLSIVVCFIYTFSIKRLNNFKTFKIIMLQCILCIRRYLNFFFRRISLLIDFK